LETLHNLQARQECEHAILLLYRSLDTGPDELIVSNFSEDATWYRDRLLMGREEIKESLRGRSATRIVRHQISNILVEPIDEAHSAASAYVVVYESDTGSIQDLPVKISHPKLFGLAEFTLTRIESKWQVQSMKTRFDFVFSGGPMG
jgi:hypothetical protein